jgi:hypothetical protein
MELKTIKDLKICCVDIIDDEPCYFAQQEIKKEVIKHVKDSRECYARGCATRISNETVAWIKEFFNLNEGDFK